MHAPVKADPRIAEFCELVKAGIESWKRAGKILCKLVDDDATVLGKILADHPYLTRETLESFERIGRKLLYPYLVVDSSPGARRLVGLPYGDQVRLYEGRIAVVTITKGITEQKFKRVFELTEAEARRVFNDDGLRTVQEQLHLLKKKPKRNLVRSAPRAEQEQEPESMAGTASLDAKPIDELKRLLTLANDALLEARTVLSTLKRGSKQDDHITTALREIGALRFAASSEDL
jgi:hypothetical protein